MSYPSQSVTERWISMIVAEGGSVPESFGLGELMKAYAEAEGGGGGWPASNGTGPGNLTAETPEADTVGYQVTDRGSGGIQLVTTGTGQAAIGDSGTGGVVVFSNGSGPALALSSSTGVNVSDFSAAGVSVVENGAGGILIEQTATGNVLVTVAAASGGTNTITLHTLNGDLTLQSTGGALVLDTEAAIQLTASAVVVTTLPTADPHVVGQLWNLAGVVQVSAG